MSEPDDVTTQDSESDGPRKGRKLAVLWRLTALLSPHTGRFALAFATLFAASLLSLVYPWAAREAVDAGMAGGSAERLDDVVALLVVVRRRARGGSA